MTNRNETYRQDVVSALDSRLKSKNSRTVSLAILLLDTLEKNCFAPFHRLVCQKDFLDNLFHIALKEQVWLGWMWHVEPGEFAGGSRPDSVFGAVVCFDGQGLQVVQFVISFVAQPWRRIQG